MTGAVVCLLTAPRIQLSVSAGNGWRHNAPRYHWLTPIGSYQSAVTLLTSEIVIKRFWSQEISVYKCANGQTS